MSDIFHNCNDPKAKPPIVDKKEKDFSKFWSGINNTTVLDIMHQTTPIVTLATLSLYRYELLFKSLMHNAKVTSTPLNMCLRVQATEEMPLNYKIKVLELLEENFKHYDVQFTFGNHGSGVPRHDVVHRALDYFNSPFIMTLDDDIILPPNAIDVMVAILRDHPQLGSITLACSPPYIVWEERGNKLNGVSPKHGFSCVDSTGSGTTITRSEVFKTCDLDTKYYIGWGDMDFGKQMKQAGWKIGVLNVPGFQALNPQQYNEPRYTQIRQNNFHIKNSHNRFKEKWGIQIA